MPELTVTRTPAEIAARAEAADDMFGWAMEVLLPYLDFESARAFLKDGVTAEEWSESMADPTAIQAEARSYYAFALGKIEDERGISAERSVIKLTEYAWLMGRDDVVAAMDAAPYPMDAAPKVAAFGEGFDFTTEGEAGR